MRVLHTLDEYVVILEQKMWEKGNLLRIKILWLW